MSQFDGQQKSGLLFEGISKYCFALLVCKQSGGKEGQESIGFAVVNVQIIDKVLTNSERMRKATPTTLRLCCTLFKAV